jgi:hypothetical protein
MNKEQGKYPANLSVHSVGMLIAENNTFHSCVISGFERDANKICDLLGFYAASIGSFLPTFRPVDCSIYLHLQGQQSKMKALRSTERSVTLHQSTGHNPHQHLCEYVMSHRIEDGAEWCYCV